MDWSFIIFAVIVVFFGYRGYRNGLLKSLARILSLIAGYAAALLLARPVSDLLESLTPLDGIVALLAASLLMFFTAGFVISLLFRMIRKLLPENETASTLSSIGGAVIGVALGLLLAFVIVWTYALLRDIAPGDGLASSGLNKPSRIEALAGKLAGKALNTAMTMGSATPEVARLSAALIESPAVVAQQAQRLAQSQELVAFLGDPNNRAVLDNGDPSAVARLPAFRQLMQNPDLLALAESTGIVAQVEGAASVDEALAIQLTDIWGRAQQAKNNPRVQEILNDAEFQRKIQSGNPVDLLANKRLLELADIIFADDPAAQKNAPVASDSGARQAIQVETGKKPKPKSNIKFHKWVDEDGNVHYSNVKPES